MSDVHFDLTRAELVNAQVVEGDEQGLTFEGTVQGGRVHLYGEPGMLGGGGYLVFDVEMRAEQSVCVMLDFWSGETAPEEESDLWVKIGVLPNLRTRIAFPLVRLDSQSMFIAPTPGQLKMVVFGKPLDIAGINHFSIGTVRTQAPYQFVLHDVRVAKELPEFPLPEGDVRVDEMGQYIPKPWKGKYEKTEDMVADLRALYEEAKAAPDRFPNPDWDAYGGYKPISFGATGFFRKEKKDGRWWLVDPEGNAFFSNGVDCVTLSMARVEGLRPFFSWLPGRDDPLYGDCWSDSPHARLHDAPMFDYIQANLTRAFGKAWFEPWAVITRYRMKQWGLNTIGNWSDERFIKWANMPYVWPMRGFPGTGTFIFRDFPDVFSDEYRQNSEAFARQLEDKKEDPCMIGYFMRNEPTWAFVEGVCIAEEMLANPLPFACKERLIGAMKDKYGDIGSFNAAWNLSLDSFEGLREPLRNAKALSPAAAEDLEAFSLAMYEAYNSIPAIACKKVDPNHMNLGMRYGYISQPGVVAGWEHLDVFSINSYYVSPVEQTRQAADLMDLPIMVGEYHFGSLEGNLTATGLRAVPLQKDRADAYRYFVEQGASHPSFVGAHYFTLYDQPVLGRFDGENYQIGLIDVVQRPYTDFTDCLAACHDAAYRVAAGLQEPWDKSAPETPKVAY